MGNFALGLGISTVLALSLNGLRTAEIDGDRTTP
jgi:hypothetical protein